MTYEQRMQGYFQRRPRRKMALSGETYHLSRQQAMNVLRLHTKKGLYVLAYRKLNQDVKSRRFHPDEDITVCTEFTINGNKESIHRY